MILASHSDVIFEERLGRGGAIGVITLNRPQALNALTYEMCLAIDKQLYQWEDDAAIKAIVIQSHHDKAFCVGGDVRHLYELGKQKCFTEAMQFFYHEYRLNYHIANYKKPYIAFLNGFTLGGGMGLSIHGSHRVGTEKLIMAMPETGIGFYPDIGATHFLSRCADESGTYIGLTGTHLNAADAQYVGLIDVVISSNHLPEVLTHLQDADLSEDANEIIAIILQAFSVKLESSPLRYHHEDLLECFSLNKMEEIIEKLNQHHSPWHKTTLTQLKSKSPTSLKVTLESLRRGISQDLATCLEMEYAVSYHFLQQHDFYEGIRAVLIDKDKQPCWSPAFLSQVSKEQVAAYFQCAAREGGYPSLTLFQS